MIFSAIHSFTKVLHVKICTNLVLY